MSNNPYAPPRATNLVVPEQAPSGPIRIYSPTQVAVGTIGGPIGLLYFLKANFAALGNTQMEKNTLVGGVLLILGLLVAIALLPDKFPATPFTIAYILTARYVAEKYQMTKQAIIDSEDHDFHSNWRVLGLSLLCLLGSVVVLLGPLMLLAMLGVLEL